VSPSNITIIGPPGGPVDLLCVVTSHLIGLRKLATEDILLKPTQLYITMFFFNFKDS